MSEYEVTPRRRLPTRWYLAPIGLIMVLQGGGVLFGWAPVPRILELLYPNREPPPFESRDLTWAWVFLFVGATLLVWIFARLAGRRQVIRADGEGVHLPLRGPLGGTTLIAWSQVVELEARQVLDDFGPFPAVLIGVEDTRLFPKRPWGARWLGGDTLSLSAEGWTLDPAGVVEQLREVRLAHAGSSHEDDSEFGELGEDRMDRGPIIVEKTAEPVPAAAEDEEGCQA